MHPSHDTVLTFTPALHVSCQGLPCCREREKDDCLCVQTGLWLNELGKDSHRRDLYCRTDQSRLAVAWCCVCLHSWDRPCDRTIICIIDLCGSYAWSHDNYAGSRDNYAGSRDNYAGSHNNYAGSRDYRVISRNPAWVGAFSLDHTVSRSIS